MHIILLKSLETVILFIFKEVLKNDFFAVKERALLKANPFF